MDEDLKTELLKKLKNSLGDFTTEDATEQYYGAALDQAYFDLTTDDIDEAVIVTDMGKTAMVLYARLVIEEKDPNEVTSMVMFRNKLSAMTKGARYSTSNTQINNKSHRYRG